MARYSLLQAVGFPVRKNQSGLLTRAARRSWAVARALGFVGVCSCAGLTGCVSDELVKSIIAENIALTASTAVQSVVNGILAGITGGLTG